MDQVVSLIETGCKDLNEAGIKVAIKANQIQIDDGNAKDCLFGADCFRKGCGQKHPPGFVSKYDPSNGRTIQANTIQAKVKRVEMEKGKIKVEARVKVATRRVKLRAVRRHHLIIRFANRVTEKD